MVWLLVAVAGYVMLAGAALIDKFLLAGKLDDPKLYAFYIGALSSAAFLLLPFGFWSYPAAGIFLIGMVAGAAQIYGSFFYLSALKRFEAARVVPIVGGLNPVFGFFLTAAVSGGSAILGQKELAGFFLLIAGGWLMMASGFSFKAKEWGFAIIAALFYALSVVLAKLVYLQLPFANGFLLTAFGSAAAAMTFLLSKPVRQAVFGKKKASVKNRPNFLFFCGQAMGGAAFLLQSGAVYLAPQANVPAVNALAGVQYVFIFAISLVLARRFPKQFAEKTTPAQFAQKIFAIILIMIGLAIFALN